MQGIIDESRLSTGSVYQYFRNKDDIVRAAVTASLNDLALAVRPVFDRGPVGGPAELVRELTAAAVASSARDGFDLTRVGLHGWGEALSNDELAWVIRRAYLAFRTQLREVVVAWQEMGLVSRSADPSDLAATLHSLQLGFLAQRALLGDADPQMYARGTAALME